MDIQIIDEQKNSKDISDVDSERETEDASYLEQLFTEAREAGFEIFTRSGLKKFVRDKVKKYKILCEEWLLRWCTHLCVHFFKI